MSAEETIRRLRAQLERQDVNHAAQLARLQRELEVERMMQGPRLRALAAHLGQWEDSGEALLHRVLSTLWTAVMWADPLRGLPMEDTPRVEVAASTPTEAAMLGGQRDRERVRRWASQLGNLNRQWERELDPTWREVRVERPQCWSKKCDHRGKRQEVGSRFCRWCGAQFSAQGEEVA